MEDVACFDLWLAVLILELILNTTTVWTKKSDELCILSHGESDQLIQGYQFLVEPPTPCPMRLANPRMVCPGGRPGMAGKGVKGCNEPKKICMYGDKVIQGGWTISISLYCFYPLYSCWSRSQSMQALASVSFFHDDHVHSMDPKRGNCGEYHKGRDNLDCKTSKMAFMF